MSNYRILPIGGGGITPSGTLSVTENGTYNVKNYQYIDAQVNPNWLCFTALEDNSSIAFDMNLGTSDDYFYTLDTVHAYNWDGSTINLDEGESVYVFGTIQPSDRSRLGQFRMTGTISASGDITSLFNKVGGEYNGYYIYSYTFNQLFMDCTSLVKAPNIDCITTDNIPDWSSGQYAKNIFEKMFYNTGLTEIPRLPHITKSIGNQLYMFDNMFGNCQSLPAKPDFSYIDNTYWLACETNGMFSGSSIEEIALPSLTNINMNYQFKRTFKDMPNLTKVDMSNLVSIGIRQFPLEECFKGCSNLSEIKIAVTTNWYNGLTNHWMKNVASTGDFYNLNGNTTIPENDDNGIPVGWRNIVSDVEPTVTLQDIVNVSSTSANVNYYIDSDGRAEITRYGVCWSTSANPTISNNHIDGTLPATIQQVYTANLTGLSDGVTYHVRAYAQNEVGLSYSEEQTFTASEPAYFIIENADPYGRQLQLRIDNYGTNQTTTHPTIYYSTDRVNFTYWGGETLTLDSDIVYLYGDNPNGIAHNASIYGADGYSTIASTHDITISGDITALLQFNGTNTIPDSGLAYIFYNTSTLTGSLDLSMVNSVSHSSFLRSFYGTSIDAVDLSGLSGSITSGRAFNSAFSGTLVENVIIPNVTELAPVDDDGVFDNAFENCTHLESISFPNLTAVRRYGLMCICRGCTSLTSINLSSLVEISGNGALESLVEGCTSLTSLDLSNLERYYAGGTSFYYMCKNCSSLSEIKIGISGYVSGAFINWMLGVAATGDFYNLGNAPFPRGADGIPQNWTVHTTL